MFQKLGVLALIVGSLVAVACSAQPGEATSLSEGAFTVKSQAGGPGPGNTVGPVRKSCDGMFSVADCRNGVIGVTPCSNNTGVCASDGPELTDGWDCHYCVPYGAPNTPPAPPQQGGMGGAGAN